MGAREPKAIFLYGDGGLHVEPSVSRAAAYMEPIDVQNGEYEAVFDDSGRQYEWKVVDGTTRLEPTGEVDLDGLMERLRKDPSLQSLAGADVEHPLQAALAIAAPHGAAFHQLSMTPNTRRFQYRRS